MKLPAVYTNPDVIGYMPMPASFHYRSLFLQGRPRHEKYDEFWRKHPPMDHVHRAKIFAPFDALAGFDECIDSKTVQYEEKRILSESEKDALNEKISLLHTLTYNGRTARMNRPTATVTYFVPCSDDHNEWFNRGGLYESYTGAVKKVDCSCLVIDDKVIVLDDIAAIDTVADTMIQNAI